jgi:hypothetical protein
VFGGFQVTPGVGLQNESVIFSEGQEAISALLCFGVAGGNKQIALLDRQRLVYNRVDGEILRPDLIL